MYPCTGGYNVFMQQGYVVGSVTSSFTSNINVAGGTTYSILLPTHPDMSCVVPTAHDFQLATEDPDTSGTSQIVSIGTLTPAQSFSDNVEDGDGSTFQPDLSDGEEIAIYDLLHHNLYSDSWCTTYDTEITAFTPPQRLNTGTFCQELEEDNNDYYIDFTPPVITSPSCTDTGNIFTTWVEATNGSFDSQNDFKAAIDIENNQIRLTTSDTSLNTSEITFLAHFTLPDGVDFSFEFKVDDGGDTCTPTLTPPSFVSSYTYQPGDGTEAQELIAWGTTDSGCNIEYSTVISGGPAGVDYDDIFTTYYGSGRGVGWYTAAANTHLEGTYMVTVAANSGCRTSSVSWEVLVGTPDPCDTETLDVSSTRFSSPALTYTASASSDSLNYLDTDATVVGGNSCGPITWTFTNSDGTALEPTVFTESTGTITVQTDDYLEAHQYDLIATATLTNYPLVSDTQAFTIVIVDPCETATIDMSTNVIFKTGTSPYLYTIDPAAGTMEFDYSNVSHDAGIVCPAITYDVRMANESTVPTMFTFTEFLDSTTGELQVQTADRSLAGTYNMKLYAQFTGYPNGNIELFDVTLVDPCPLATISHATNPFSDQTYTLGDGTANEQSWVSANIYSLAGTTIDCGDITVEAEYAPVDAIGNVGTFVATTADSKFSVDNANDKFIKPVSTDVSEAGVYRYHHKVYLTDYTAVTTTFSAQSTFTIVDPCATTSITVPAQTDPVDYYYSADSPKATITLNPYVETVNACDITYTCSTESGPVGFQDLCTLSDGATGSSINPTTGAWNLETIDMVNYPEGTYTIRITGTSGGDSSTNHNDFTLELINPCHTITVNHVGIEVYGDYTYVLGQSLLTVPWINAIATLSPTTPVDCGDLAVKFYWSNDNGSTYNEGLTHLTYDIPNQNVQLPANVDLTFVGDHPFQYDVYLVDYPTQITSTAKNDGKKVTIIDPCANPTLVVPSFTDPADYLYTGTGDPRVITIEAFSVIPPVCTITYNIAPLDASLSTLFTDPESSTDYGAMTATIGTTDMTSYPVGDYVFRITATTGTTSNEVKTYDTTLKFVDPCPAAFKLKDGGLPFNDVTQFLRDPLHTDSYHFALAYFDTEASDHCGDVTLDFLMTKDGGSEVALGDPFVMDQVVKEFQIPYTEDLAHAGSYVLKYTGKADNYWPTTPLVESNTWTVDITDPCLSPNVAVISQTTADAEYTISQSLQSTTITDFIVNPAWCDVTYTYTIAPPLSLMSVDTDNKVYSFYEASSLGDTDVLGPNYSQTYTITLTGTSDSATETTTFDVVVKNPCVDPAYNAISVPADYSVSYEVQKDALVVDYTQLYDVTLSAVCGDISFTLVSGTSAQITQDALLDQISIYSDDLSLIGTEQTVVVSSVLANYGTVTGTDLTITLQFIECQVDTVTTSTITGLSYQIGDPAVEITADPFSSLDAAECNYSWVYSASLVSNPFGGGTMADYITFDASTMTFTVRADAGTALAQSLEVVLTGTLDNGQEFETDFMLIYTAAPEEEVYVVPANLEPEFVQSLESLVVVDVSSEVASIDIGQLIDYEDDPFSIIFSGDSTSFVQAKLAADGTISLDIDQTAAIKNGNYTLELVVNELAPDGTVQSSNTFSLTVEIVGNPEEDKVDEDSTVETPADVDVPSEIVVDINDTSFEKPDIIVKEAPTMAIKRISRYGLVEIDFSQPLMLPANITHVNSTSIDVQVTAYEEQWQELMGFTWEIESFQAKSMTIQLAFEYPAQITQEIDNKDILSIKVLRPTDFISKTSFKTVKNETVVDLPIPKQLAEADKEIMNTVTEQAAQITESSGVLVGGSFAMNILLASSLSLLWGLIHALQLVTHLPLLNVTFPDTTKVYYEAMLQIATMDVLPTDDIKQIVQEEVGSANKAEENFDAEGVLSDSTIEAGYEDSNVLLNSMFNLILIGAIVVVLLIILLVWIFFKRLRRINNCLKAVWRAIFWNMIIRSTMETYIELVINNMIKLHALDYSTWFESTSSVFALIALTALTIFGLSGPIFLYCKRDVLMTPQFIAKYGSLTIDLNMKKKLAMFYTFFFTVRRLIFGGLIVFFVDKPYAQIQIICFSFSVQLIYVGFVAPYIMPWQNVLEVTNEYIVLTSTYFLFIYSDGLCNIPSPLWPKVPELVKDTELMKDIGWVNTGLLGLQVAINLVVMLTAQIAVLIRKIKLKCLKRQHSKKMKEAQAKKLLKDSLRQDELEKLSRISTSGSNQVALKSKKRSKNQLNNVQPSVQSKLPQIPEAASNEEAGSAMAIDSQQEILLNDNNDQLVQSVAMSDLEAEASVMKNKLNKTRAAEDQRLKIKNDKLLQSTLRMQMLGNQQKNGNPIRVDPKYISMFPHLALSNTTSNGIPEGIFTPKRHESSQQATDVFNTPRSSRQQEPFRPRPHQITTTSSAQDDYLAVQAMRQGKSYTVPSPTPSQHSSVETQESEVQKKRREMQEQVNYLMREAKAKGTHQRYK